MRRVLHIWLFVLLIAALLCGCGAEKEGTVRVEPETVPQEKETPTVSVVPVEDSSAPEAPVPDAVTSATLENAPEPVEPEEAVIKDETSTCTISISCEAILNNMDTLDPEKADLVPEDGWILESVEIEFNAGESVFDVLQKTCRQEKIHLEFVDTPGYHSAYIEGIYNLYEFDCGNLSGWMYSVNGWFPNYGCSRYQVQDGDVICWEYTCDLGADVKQG